MDQDRDARTERSSEMTNLKLTARYARYLITSLAAIAFGMNLNEPTGQKGKFP
jgi:hypothetical protein